MHQAKLTRLRFLLAELLEQLKADAFDPIEWKETTFVYQEANQLCDELGQHPVVVIEGDWVTSGRLTTWRPMGAPPIQADIHATKRLTFHEALWHALRKSSVTNNLRRWVRFVDQLANDEAPDDGPQKQPADSVSDRQQPPAALLDELTRKQAEVLRFICLQGSATWDEVAVGTWPQADGGTSEKNARRTVDRLIKWLSDHGWPRLVEVQHGHVSWVRQT